MTAGQNQFLLESLANGRMRFDKVGSQRRHVGEPAKSNENIGDVVESQLNADISWAYEDKQSGSPTPVSI
jgi:hypothetical protein